MSTQFAHGFCYDLLEKKTCSPDIGYGISVIDKTNVRGGDGGLWVESLKGVGKSDYVKPQ